MLPGDLISQIGFMLIEITWPTIRFPVVQVWTQFQDVVQIMKIALFVAGGYSLTNTNKNDVINENDTSVISLLYVG